MNIHFISIGGSVMHQLAIALHKKGYKITGSDDEIFEPSKANLAAENLLPAHVGWFSENIHKNLDAVILGMHAKEDNPELLVAKELQLPVYSFPEYIYKESTLKNRVVIGGSHGKTTTTAMIMHVLKQADKKFDYLVGARLEGFQHSVNITDAPLIICEGDEYPASTIEKRPKFHFLFPHIAVLTGIAWDHINVFPTFEFYLEQFVIFINKIEKGGHLIYNETDEVLKSLVEKNRRSDIEYHPYQVPSHTIDNALTQVEIEGVKTTLKVFGAHNLLNMQAAWLVCRILGVDALTFTKAIGNFAGAAKRLELIASSKETFVYRDFAHAPSKLKATIEATKAQYPNKKIIAVFELHTYSSLNDAFMKEYGGSLDKADEAVVYYSSHALAIKRLPALDEAVVRSGFGKGNISVINTKEGLESWLQGRQFNNSVVLFMSSGNYDGLDLMRVAKSATQTSVL